MPIKPEQIKRLKALKVNPTIALLKMFTEAEEKIDTKIDTKIEKRAEELVSQILPKIKEDLLLQVKSEVESRNSILEHITQLKGDKGDTPTKEEIVNMIKPLIPKPIRGRDGRNPLHVGKNPPTNPQKGDLWYQD